MTPLPAPSRGVVLALGGGAALGWAHLGVLAGLAEARVPIAAVAGTSMGALAGVCLAAGRLDALEEIARGATRKRVIGYLDPHWGRGAWLGGRRIARELDLHLGPHQLDALAMPCACVAADLSTGAEVRLTSGPAALAVQASIALPGVFRPVRIEGRWLIDGGMVALVPVAAARALAPARPLVAVDLFGDHLRPGPPPRTGWSINRRGFQILLATLTAQALALDPPDLILRPTLGRFSMTSFTSAEALIALGREAATAALPRLRALAAR